MIRKALETDVTSINKLGLSIDDDYLKKTDINKDINLISKLLYVITNNERVIGFISLNNFQDEMEILDIVIDKNYRNQGNGYDLLDYVLNENKKKCFLEVNENNSNAIKLYEKLGFNVISIRKNYYKGADAYIMERKF